VVRSVQVYRYFAFGTAKLRLAGAAAFLTTSSISSIPTSLYRR
jgi:hypothetical protein